MHDDRVQKDTATVGKPNTQDAANAPPAPFSDDVRALEAADTSGDAPACEAVCSPGEAVAPREAPSPSEAVAPLPEDAVAPQDSRRPDIVDTPPQNAKLAKKAGGNILKKKRRAGGRRILRAALKLARRVIILAFVLACALCLYAYFIVYKNATAPKAEPETANVEIADVRAVLTATGNIIDNDDKSLFVNTAHKVSRVPFKAGDRVKAGDAIAFFDVASERERLISKRDAAELNLKNAELAAQAILLPATGNELLSYSADVETANSNVRDAQSEVEASQIRINQQAIKVADTARTFEKNAELLSGGFVSQDIYDASLSAKASATESLRDLELQKNDAERALERRLQQLTEAKTRLENARNRLSDKSAALRHAQQTNVAELYRIEIRQIELDLGDLKDSVESPINGYVKSVSVVEGGTLQPGTAAAVISDVSITVAEAEFSEYDAPKIAVGQSASLRTSAFPDEAFLGKVTRVSSDSLIKEGAADDEVIVPVEITLDAADGRLLPGFTVDAEVVIAESSGVLCVPARAITYDDDNIAYVYVQKEKMADTEADSNADSVSNPNAGGNTDADIGAVAVANTNANAGANTDTDADAASGGDADGGPVATVSRAFDTAKKYFLWARDRLDEQILRFLRIDGTSDEEPVFIMTPVVTGLVGQNGVEIVDGDLAKGDTVLMR